MRRSILLLLPFAYLFFGLYLFLRSLPSQLFSETQLIRDLIWLDAWSIAFVVAALAAWHLPLSRRTRGLAVIGLFSLYGLVAIAVMLSGTPFSFNAYWGDQQFRQAIILKFLTFAIPADMYYQNLPLFYPPLFYWLLSLWGRLFGVEAVSLLKVGNMLVCALGPWLLYLLWRRLVSPLQALFVTLATFLLYPAGVALPAIVPHAFLGDSLFIPWWLHFVERINARRSDWRFALVGGLIGALLFSTYFYAFFIAAFLLLLRCTLLPFLSARLRSLTPFRTGAAAKVLGLAALFSSPYWLPLIISIVANGADRTRGGWHHLGTVGLSLTFMDFSLIGLITILGVVYAARQWRGPLFGGLLLLLGVSVLWLGIGSILGALNHPVNLIKTTQFVSVLGAAIVGLALATLWRMSARRPRWRVPVGIALTMLLLIFVHNHAAMGKHEWVRVARKAVVPTWKTDSEVMARNAGAVMLSGLSEFHSFYPLYAFLSTNEHYSHPASRYIDRYTLLHLLEPITDPALLHLALRHNRFDPVDLILPHVRDGRLKFYANISNYPNRYTSKTLSYSPSILRSDLFAELPGQNLYQLAPGDPSYQSLLPAAAPRDPLMFARLRLIRGMLSDSGIAFFDKRVAPTEPDYIEYAPSDTPAFGDKLRLLRAFCIFDGDSAHYVFAWQPCDEILQDCRIFLHLYESGPTGPRANYDFAPSTPTSNWAEWDVVFTQRTVPRAQAGRLFHVGFFRGEERMGTGYWSREVSGH